MKGLFILSIFISSYFSTYSQSTNREIIENVFQKLVYAYGSPKAAPKLILSNEKITTPAFYSKNDKSITIDKKLTTICYKLGKDSLNALSIIISHELAHYYSEHDFCSDFGYSMKLKNEAFSNKIIKLSIDQKLIYETQADRTGLYYSAIAGFHPFEINSILLDQIYTAYSIKDVSEYPSKSQRKEIGETSNTEIHTLYTNFKKGIKLLNECNYNEAILEFKIISQNFPSREIYNNIGIAKTRLALLSKPFSKEEVDFPNRFKYPLEVENKTRLNREETRSIQIEDNFTKLLKAAQSDFEKAISLDPSFVKSYINLACIYDLLDNPDNAIGTIKRLSKVDQNTVDSKMILAIAYFHSDRESLAEKIWKELNL